MGLLERFSSSNAGPARDVRDLTMVKRAQFDGGGGRSLLDALATPDGSAPNLPEEVKRRQVALLLRYVVTVRAR